MKIWLLIEYRSYSTFVFLFEGKHNDGVVDQFKRHARENGGRVAAIIRPKT